VNLVTFKKAHQALEHINSYVWSKEIQANCVNKCLVNHESPFFHSYESFIPPRFLSTNFYHRFCDTVLFKVLGKISGQNYLESETSHSPKKRCTRWSKFSKYWQFLTVCCFNYNARSCVVVKYISWHQRALRI